MTVFESPGEFFDACMEGTVPETVHVVWSTTSGRPDIGLAGDGAEKFSIAQIPLARLLEEAFRRAGNVRLKLGY